MTRHLATLRESSLLPPFTRAWLNFFTLTFRALGRNHIASTPLSGHRNAMFSLDSQIPLVRTSSKLVVKRTPDDRSLPRAYVLGAGRRRPEGYNRPAPRGSSQGPTYPTLRANPFPEVTDLFCRLPLPTLFYQLEAFHLGDLLRL